MDEYKIVSIEEGLQNPWRDICHDAGAARIRLYRLRGMLDPLHLGGTNGLICFFAGNYALNPKYTLHFDTEEFLELIKRSESISYADENGIALCVRALELYRGPLFENTSNAPWLMRQRGIYHAKFCKLGQSLINRMKALDTDVAFPLLWQRAAVVAGRTTASGYY